MTLRLALLLAAAAALAGCATSKVSLYPDADGTTGAVAVMRPDTEAEVGALTQPNTWTWMNKKVSPRAVKRPHTELMSQMPPPPKPYVLYFEEGSTTVKASSLQTLEELRRAVDENSWVQITGHTDTVGSTEDNDRLSRERALEIRDVLVAQGLPVQNAKTTGRGEREPQVKTGDGVDNADNRRVEVILR